MKTNEEIKEDKIKYQGEQVVNSIIFELKEAQEDCKEEGEDFNPADYESRIYRGLIFNNGNFQYIVGLMFTEEDNEKAQLGGVMIKGRIEEKYQNQLFSELWEKAIKQI